MSRLRAHLDADSAKKLNDEFTLRDESGTELARGFWATVFSFVMYGNDKEKEHDYELTNESTGITFGPFRRK